MNGTRKPQNRAMDRIPPRMTAAVKAAMAMPNQRRIEASAWESQHRFFYHHHFHDRVRLGHVADAEGGEGGEGGKENSRPAGVQAAFQNKHRTSGHFPAVILDAILHGEQGLGIFGGDPKDPGQPHPKDSTRPADQDGSGHPVDISGADRGRQGGHEGAKLADIARGTRILGDRKANRQGKMTLNQAGTPGEKEMGAVLS